MDIRKVTWFLLLYAGETLIIISFLYFGRNINSKILTLNIIVSSFIYSLYFFEIIIPKVNFKDKSHKAVGSLGLRWFFTYLYTFAAIGVMIIFNTVQPIDFNSQVIIHGILFFLITLGLFQSITASDKVRKVYKEEKQIYSYLDEMNKTVKEIQLKINQMKDLPSEISTRMITLQENLRFISPCNNQEALELEMKFITELKLVQDNLLDIPVSNGKIMENIQNCERIYKERKQIFSN